MRTIKNLVENTNKRVYVHLVDENTCLSFIEQAEKEGYTFADEKKLSERKIDNFYAINKDKTLNHIHTMGRIAWQCRNKKILRVDYNKYISGDSNYII